MKCERCKEEYVPDFEHYIQEWSLCLKCDREATENFLKGDAYFPLEK